MNSRWENGTAMTYGNQGLTIGGQVCKYLYPGNSDPYGFSLGGNCNSPVTPNGNYSSTAWTELQAGNQPGDRRFIVNVGKFTMQPGGVYNLDYALVFSQDTANCVSNDTCIIPKGIKDNIRVKQWFNNNTFPSCLNLSTVDIKKSSFPELNLTLYPNPTNTNLFVEFNEMQQNLTIEVFDMLGNLVGGYTYTEINKYATIPVNALQSGIYLVKIQSVNGISVKKFVKD